MEVVYKTPLFQKLGIEPDSKLVILNQPIGVLQGLEKEFKVHHKLTKESDLIIFFGQNKQELAKKFPVLKNSLTKNGNLWICWPKKASKVETDLDVNLVQKIGLENGLVDVKVVSIDEVWSGLKFVFRLKDR